MVIGFNASQLTTREKSGIEFVVESMIQAFIAEAAKRGDRLRLYTREPFVQNFPEHIEVRALSWPFPWLWTQARLGFELLLNPPDAFVDISNFFPLLSLLRTSKKYFFAHDYSFIRYPRRYTLSRRLLMRVGNYLSGMAANGIFTPTEYTREAIREHFPRWYKKTHTVGLGLRERFSKSLNGASDPETVPPGCLYFLFVGRIGNKIDARKNLDNLVRGFHAWNMTRDNRFSLVLCGRDDGSAEELRKLARDIGFQKLVFTGFVSDQELANLYVRSQGVVLTTVGEGYGLPIVEGLAAGKPVMVSTETGGISHDLGDRLVFCQPDAAGIALGFEELSWRRDQESLVWETYEDVVRKMYAVML